MPFRPIVFMVAALESRTGSLELLEGRVIDVGHEHAHRR